MSETALEPDQETICRLQLYPPAFIEVNLYQRTCAHSWLNYLPSKTTFSMIISRLVLSKTKPAETQQITLGSLPIVDGTKERLGGRVTVVRFGMRSLAL
jgi:hypothetical protein